MRWAAHDPDFAKRMDIPRSVAREYVEADKKKSKRPPSKKHRQR